MSNHNQLIDDTIPYPEPPEVDLEQHQSYEHEQIVQPEIIRAEEPLANEDDNKVKVDQNEIDDDENYKKLVQFKNSCLQDKNGKQIRQ